MLTYHPIHDPSHCIFRLFCLLQDLEQPETNWELLKILDFYVLFPHLIIKMSFPQDLIPYKVTLRTVAVPYESLPAPSRLMFELGEIQEQTVKAMIAKGLIDKEAFLSGRIKMRDFMLPKEISEAINSATFRQADWYKFLTQVLWKWPLKGRNGLKERTGLMEYRYDAV